MQPWYETFVNFTPWERFLLAWVCLFSFLTVFFVNRNVCFKSDQTFLLWILFYVSCQRNLCLLSILQRYSAMFPFKHLLALVFTFASMIHLGLIFVYGMRSAKFLSFLFLFRYQVIPAKSVEKNVFFPLNF